ncbi:MAG: DNA ligase [Theionarchaea archaeon]|nr:DNA ligase [Theionarchaea archaeon]MBU7038941.1 DNA ligase [Theionarchaea archaeon]
MQTKYQPMLARSSGPFTDKDWIFEVKWDGTRAVSYINQKSTFINRRGVNITDRYPELQIEENVTAPCVLDGEIVVLVEGKPSFPDLQRREHIEDPFKIQILSTQLPAVYIVFDILRCDSRDLTQTPLLTRKRILQQTVSESERVLICPYVQEKGEDYFKAVTDSGFEGIMAKKKDSFYYPGKRSGSWLKIKKTLTADCVIGGFTQGEGVREPTFGALVLGVGCPLELVGKVGSGFTDDDLIHISALLTQIETDENPFSTPVPYDTIHFVRPEYVCEVKYQQMTHDKKLRAPVFLRMRYDKTPAECIQ